MSSSNNVNSKVRDKFYNKIRQGIKDFEERLTSQNDVINCDDNNRQQQVDETKLITRQRSEPSKYKESSKPGQLFGKVSSSEFEKILDTYESQQLVDNQRENPVFTKKIDAGSFDKLLYSKIGFHHMKSTDYLLEDLNMNDLNRYTFLGGQIGRHDLFEGEDLPSLIRKHNKIYIRQYLQEAWHYLLGFEGNSSSDIQIAKDRIDRAAKLDPKNGDVSACLGRYHYLLKDFTKALDLFKYALTTKLDDPAKVKMMYADCFYELGYRAYSGQKYNEGLKYLDKALEFYPIHNGAQMHRNLCIDQINRSKAFASSRQPAYRK